MCQGSGRGRWPWEPASCCSSACVTALLGGQDTLQAGAHLLSVTPQASHRYDGPSPLSAWHPVLDSGSRQAKVSPSGDIPAGQADSRPADSHWGASQPGCVVCAGTHTRAPGTVRPLHAEWSVSPSCLGSRQERCCLEEHTGLGLGLASALCCCVTLDRHVDVAEHPCACA